MVQSYRDLKVWQKAMDLVINSYKVTDNFPSQEKFGLSSQLQRAAVSIPANIAEGHGRNHTREYLQFLSIAYGSLMELETHLQIAQRLNYIDIVLLQSLIKNTEEIGRMLNGLQRTLKNKLSTDP